MLVVFVMKRFIAEYRYTLSDGTLVLERTMGSTHGRVLYALPVTDLLALDDEAALKARFGENTHIESLTLAGCTLPRRALAFKKDGQTCIAVLADGRTLRGGAARGDRQSAAARAGGAAGSVKPYTKKAAAHSGRFSHARIRVCAAVRPLFRPAEAPRGA